MSHSYCYDIYGYTKMLVAENSECQGLIKKTTTEKGKSSIYEMGQI